ncbi:MAG TPA: hypothetical protein VE077_14300 [Candidatus Methylomirabilis sp.]|nr:hypothetical protein [Candidatus Methylomirabilis sp.]
MTSRIVPTPGAPPASHAVEARRFVILVLLLISAAIVRSAIATRLDGFTIDEPYHIAAGVSYVRYAAFRINPEQPPLVKLWVGAFIAATGFRLESIRPFTDKADERDFTEEDVYLKNDFNAVQRRARVAMWLLNGLLLLLLAAALRRSFGSGVALGTLLILAIDPTVAAHLPVVMMDLPVSLLAATAIAFAVRAFRTWAWVDVLLCAGALGLTLGAKHSAPVFLLVVILTGVVVALAAPVVDSARSRWLRLGKLVAVLAGALAVLWGCYLFRYAESNTGREVFNRALASKIEDVQSRSYRALLTAMARTHVVPRAYLWGFADTIRAGFEGREEPITAFGHAYLGSAPRYYFPAIILLKLPIGTTIVVLIGLFFFFARRLPTEHGADFTIVFATLLLFLLVLVLGSTYGGIRHALPVVVLLDVFGGAAISAVFASRRRAWRIAVVVALIAAAASAVPVMRPWEYFNEFVGGTKNAYRDFSDEGVDLGQRGKELADYYHRVLEPARQVPVIFYGPIDIPEMIARGLDWLGRDVERDEVRLSSANFTGAVLIDARFVGPKPFWDAASLRARVPSQRFGNLLIYQGPCACGALFAFNLYELAISKIYAEKPDLQAGQRLLRESTSMDPSAFFASIELGNVSRKLGSREDAVRAYSGALRNAPSDDLALRQSLQQQIQRVSTEPLDQVPDLRNPFLE